MDRQRAPTLDQAVADAYGSGAKWRPAALPHDEILARFVALNQARGRGALQAG